VNVRHHEPPRSKAAPRASRGGGSGEPRAAASRVAYVCVVIIRAAKKREREPQMDQEELHRKVSRELTPHFHVEVQEAFGMAS
jgi:hypothetical protein